MTEDNLMRSLAQRIDHLERNFRNGSQTLITIEGSLNMMKSEHEHLREMLDIRLKAVEKAQEVQSLKTDQMLQSLQIISAEVDKSPLGRALKDHIINVTEKVDEHKAILANMLSWQNKVDGVLNVLKWMGATGVVALGISILRMLKVIP